MNNRTVNLLPTGNPNIFYCTENHRMYAPIIKDNKIIKYIPLVDFIAQKDETTEILK